MTAIRTYLKDSGACTFAISNINPCICLCTLSALFLPSYILYLLLPEILKKQHVTKPARKPEWSRPSVSLTYLMNYGILCLDVIIYTIDLDKENYIFLNNH